MRKVWCAIVIVLVAAACSRKVAVEFPAQPLTVLIYAEGKVAQHCRLAPDSDKFKKLAALMRQQDAQGWQKHSGTFAPSVLVEGSEISLSFAGDAVVLNDGKGEYVHPIGRDSYSFLQCKAN